MDSIDIIIFDEDELTRILIAGYLKELAVLCRIKEYGSLSDENIQMDDTPKILLVNTDNYNPDVFSRISELSKNKNIIIAAMSYDSSANLQVKAFRAGVKDFLAKPLIKQNFISAIQSIYRRYIFKTNSKAKSKVYTAVSDRRGSGKSAFLLNLARETADISSQKVLLLDFNNSQDRISSLLGADTAHNAGYYINNISEENAEALLADVPEYKNSKLFIIAENFAENKHHQVKKEKLSAAVNILKKHYKYIFIDNTPEEQTNTYETLVNISDEIFCIILPSAVSFDKVKNFIDSCDKNKNIKIILNQYTAEDKTKAEHIQQILGREIFWKIPKNYTAAKSAASNNEALKEAAEGTEIANTYLDLAKFLAGRD